MTEAEKQQYLEILTRIGTATALEDRRKAFDDIGLAFGFPSDASWEPATIGGRPAEWVTATSSPNKCILYLHGGGFAFGSPKGYRHLAAELARASNARVLLLDYRLLPEHIYPAALDDALAAYEHLLDQFRAEQIAVVGDSAGGNLTVSMLLRAKHKGLKMPGCAVCISPFLDPTANGGSATSKAAVDLTIKREGVLLTSTMYFGGTDQSNWPPPLLEADLSGFPPVLIHVGSDEVLLDDSTRLATRAAHCEVRTTLEVWPGMPHVFTHFFPILADGKKALRNIGAFIEETCT